MPPEEQQAKKQQEEEKKVQSKDAAVAITEWLQWGHGTKIVNDKFEASESPSELFKDWLAKAPTLPIPARDTLSAGERVRLEFWFWCAFWYLVFVGTVSACVTVLAASRAEPNQIIVSLFAGLFGSCVAAFRSCLDRRANGYEDADGNVSPDPKATKERFNDGMRARFFGRPLLGAAVGTMTYFALRGKVFGEQVSEVLKPDQTSLLVFYTWLAGLFAKTILDLFLDVTKKIFSV